MSKKLVLFAITKMHIRLNKIIEENDYNLLCEEVLNYSQRLDKVISYYNKISKEDGVPKPANKSSCSV
ncbi:MAG: Spo0E family sporulation regulatory protein-aspartic acid phosphatase [Clostridium sp.]|nr:Spo0E family sporulation regulatory protein-aspartic acid phosphatase [Clostridium sp.]